MPSHYGGNRGMGGSRRRRGAARRRPRRNSTGSPMRRSRARGMRGVAAGRRPRMGRMSRPMSNRVSMIPDLPRGTMFTHVNRSGGAENSSRADLFACPGPNISEDCHKLTDTQVKFWNGERPYHGN